MEKGTVLYMPVDSSTLDEIRRGCNCWASGEENICCTSEQLIEFNDKFTKVLGDFGGDVIIYKGAK